MGHIRVKKINVVQHIISLARNRLLITATKEGAKLVYLSNRIVSQKLIKKLYTESFGSLKNLSEKLSISYILPIKPQNIQRQIESIINLINKNFTSSLILRKKIIQQNITDDVISLLNTLHNKKAELEKHFERDALLHLSIVYDPNLRDRLISFLEQISNYNFIRTFIYFPNNIFLYQENQRWEYIQSWLEFFQESGYSFPFIFESPQLLLNKKGFEIIQYTLESGLAQYIDIDHTKLLRLNSLKEQENYIDNYETIISKWLNEWDFPFLSLYEFVRIIKVLTAPLRKEFVLLLDDDFDQEFKHPTLDELNSLYDRFSSFSSFLGPLLPSLLPFHLYYEKKHGFRSWDDMVLKKYTQILEKCVTFIIEELFKECEASIEENRPLKLDLNQSKPTYIPQSWDKARSIFYSAKNE